jgi:predicted peptidase
MKIIFHSTAVFILAYMIVGPSPVRAEAVPLPSSTKPASSGDSVGFIKRTLEIDGKTFKYQVFIPKTYDKKTTWPVILALHGSGGMGTDGEKQVTKALGPVVSKQADTFRAIVVFPQTPKRGKDVSPEDEIALDFKIIMKSLDQTIGEWNADKKRVYLTGASAGAFRSWGLAYKYPERFAALVPIAGGFNSKMITGDDKGNEAELLKNVPQRLKDVPIWMFHGARDGSVPVSGARQIDQAFKSAGVPFKYTEYPSADHNSWDPAYADPKLWEWLWAQHKN